MIQLLKFIDGPWDKAKKFLKNDLDTIQAAINQRWAATFGNSNVLKPSAGGSGVVSHTAHGLLVGEGTQPVVSLPAATNGQLPIGSTGVDPVIAGITAGTGMTVTNGAGSITLAPTPHALLDGVIDNDTLAAAPVLGDVIVGNTTPKWARLPGQITSTQKFLSQTGTGAVSAVPSWQTISAVQVTDDTTTNATMYPVWVSGSPGNEQLFTSTTGLNWNPSTKTLDVGTASSGVVSVLGRLSITNTQLDNANMSFAATVVMPTVITTTRSAFNFDVTTAGSSSFITQGMVFTMEAGYTGSAAVKALVVQSAVATTGFAVGVTARMVGAAGVNIGINAFCNTGTQNIAIFGGVGTVDGSTFSSGISACLVLANGTTTSDLIQAYSNVTKKFSVADSGNLTVTGQLIAGAASFVTWNGRSAMSSPSDGVVNITKQSTVTGFSLDGTTDGVCAVRTRGSAADAAVSALGYQVAGAATTGHVLRGNGTNFVDSALAATDLSDYASGSWTPIDSSGASLTFTSAAGTYVKIGKLVFITGKVVYPITANGASALVGGLPFTCNTTFTALAVGFDVTGLATNCYVNQSATTISLVTSAGANVSNAQMSTGNITFAGCYISA